MREFSAYHKRELVVYMPDLLSQDPLSNVRRKWNHARFRASFGVFQATSEMFHIQPIGEPCASYCC